MNKPVSQEDISGESLDEILKGISSEISSASGITLHRIQTRLAGLLLGTNDKNAERKILNVTEYCNSKIRKSLGSFTPSRSKLRRR